MYFLLMIDEGQGGRDSGGSQAEGAEHLRDHQGACLGSQHPNPTHYSQLIHLVSGACCCACAAAEPPTCRSQYQVIMLSMRADCRLQCCHLVQQEKAAESTEKVKQATGMK